MLGTGDRIIFVVPTDCLGRLFTGNGRLMMLLTSGVLPFNHPCEIKIIRIIDLLVRLKNFRVVGLMFKSYRPIR